MSHDTRIRGSYGNHLFKVMLREKGSNPSAKVLHSMIVRSTDLGVKGQRVARGVAQQVMDSEGMRNYYPAETEYKGRH